MGDGFRKSFEPVLSHFRESLPVFQNFHVGFSCLRFLRNEEFAVAACSGAVLFLNVVSMNMKVQKVSENLIYELLLFSNDNFVLAVEESTIHILDTSTLYLSRSVTFKSKYGIIERTAFSFEESSCFIKFSSGRLLNLSLSTTFDSKTLIKDSPVIDFAVTPDSLFLCFFKHLSLFNPNLEKQFERKIEINAPYKISTSSTNRYFSLYNRHLFKISYKNKLERISKISLEAEILLVSFSPDDKYALLYLNNFSLLVLSCPSSDQLLRIPIESETCKSLQISGDSSKIFLCSGQKLVTIKFPKSSKLVNFKSFSEVDLSFNSFLKPFEDLVFHIGVSSNIKVTQTHSKKTFFLSGHEDLVTCILTLNDSICASGSADFDIRIWNYSEKICVGLLRGHIAAVTCLAAFEDWLISGSLDQTVKVWDWKSCSLFHTINLELKVVGIAVWDRSLMVGLPDKLLIWDLLSFSLVGFASVSTLIDCFQLECQGKQILINKSKKFFIKNPLWDSTVSVWGNGGGFTFMQHVVEMMNGNPLKYEKHLNSFVVLPYQYNICHFYAFFGLTDHLASALMSGCAIFSSVNNQHPLLLALNEKHMNSASVILEVSNKTRFYPLQFRNLTNEDLIKVNSSGVNELEALYELMWYESLAVFPKYSSTPEVFPSIFKSNSPSITSLNFFNKISGNDSGFEISYFSTLNMFPVSCGTSESIKFLESLPVGNKKVFTSDYIQQVLLFKWSKSRWLLRLEGAIFLAYLAQMIGSIVYLRSYESLIFMNVISVVISTVMLIKIFLIARLSGWNIVDIFRQLLLIVYTIENFTNNKTEIEVVLILVVILSCVQGIYYFALFTSTRLLTKKLVKMVIRVFNFMIVLAYLLGTLHFVLDSAQYWIGFEKLLVFHNVFLMVLSFFLLAFILGLTSYKYKLENDLIEITGILIELEKMFFWKRNMKKNHYFQLCKPTVHSKLTLLKKSLNSIQLCLLEEESLTKNLKTIEKTFTEIEESLFSLKDLH
jgi:hypothetical protein